MEAYVAWLRNGQVVMGFGLLLVVAEHSKHTPLRTTGKPIFSQDALKCLRIKNKDIKAQGSVQFIR